MLAIILAAGAGTRGGMNIPKSLIEINGATLLKNQIETLHRLDDTILVTVVTGYKNHLVEQEIYKLRDIHPMIKTVYNTEAQNMGIVRSLELAATTIVEDAVLRLSGDLFFGPEADMHALIRHS